MKRICSSACIGLTYAIFALLWIFFSDAVLGFLTEDPTALIFISTIKGSVFVLTTALVLFLLLRWNESQRRNVEERFHRLADNAQDLIYRYRFSPTRGFDYVSPAALGITGYSPEEHYADPDLALRLVHPDDRAMFEQVVRDSAFDKPLIIRWIRKDGSVLWTEQRNVPIRDEQGNLVAVEGIARDITERKGKESTLRLQIAALESTASGVVITNREGTIVWVNKAFSKMTGYQREEVEGKNPRFLKSGHQGSDFYRNLWETILSGKVWRGEMVNRRKDGTTYVEEQTITPVLDESGAINHFVAVKQDSTERIRAAELLVKSEQKHRELIEQASDGIILADKQGNIQLVNEVAARMMGYTGDELRRMTIAQTYPEEDREEARDRVLEIGQKGHLRFERRILRKDGTTFPVEVSLHMLADGTSQGILRDITERKQAERQIREQAALLDIVPDAIIIRDLDNQIRFWNKGAESIYGWQPEEIIGKPASGNLYSAEKDRFSSILEDMKKGGSWEGEVEHLTKAGKAVIVRSRSRMIHDADGRPLSVLSVNTDITEQKSFETQFLRAQRLESLGTLAGGIAHDLNNVLAPILLSFESLKRRITDEKAVHMLSVAESSALRGKQIVSQVLTFARGFESFKGPLQLRNILNEVDQIIKETFPRSIEVKASIAAGLSMILGDITQIHQVLMNLCLNARDAMQRGGRLTISASNIDLDEAFASMRIGSHKGPYVLLEIADTGEGIAKENLERVFDPFFTTKGVGKGTGLGLSTVHTIVKGHGGFVDVISAPGTGTTFRIYIPAIPGSLAEPRTRPAELPRGNQELILIVDDETSIREITSQMLESFGYRCLSASDGVDGVTKLAMQKDDISLVIMDMMMPVMDGPSAIRAMRKIQPELKFIVSSGNLPDERDLVGEFGVSAFLPKPYTAEKLLTTIQHALKGELQVS